MNWFKKLTKYQYLSLAIVVCFTSQSFAEVSVNGFISVSAGTLIDDDVGVYRGYDGDWSTDPDTTFGLQFSAPIGEKLTATGQLIAHGSDDYNLEAEWAYVSYEVNEQWQIRGGRLRSPFFNYSDYLDVGYAYPWIRPPEQVYRFAFNTVEGFDAIYTGSLGDWDTSAQFYYGRLTDETVLGGQEVDIDLKQFTGINFSLSYDWLTLRATWNQADVSVSTPPAAAPLLAGLETAGFSQVAQALRIDERKGVFWGLGMNIDHNDWLVSTEYTAIDVDPQSLIGDDTAWYLLVGKRFGDFTVHVTHQEQASDHDLDFLNQIPDGAAPALDQLKAGAIAAIGESENDVNSIGVRWDFSPSAAFKIEYSDIKMLAADGSLLSVSVDVVF